MKPKPQDNIQESGLWEPLKAIQFAEEKLIESRPAPYQEPEKKPEREPTPEVPINAWLQSYIDEKIEARKELRAEIIRNGTAN